MSQTESQRDAKTIAQTRTTTSRLMEALDANGHGNVHGGVIMRMVDEAAAIVAIRHSGGAVVTARLDHMDFLAPAHLGNLVTIECQMEYVGRTSMEVAVRVLAETLVTREVRLIGRSHVVFVAIDLGSKRPRPVPPLIPADDDEAKIIARAAARRERLRAFEEQEKRIEQSERE